MNWLTVLLGSLIILAVLTGYARGLVAMLVGMVGYAVSLFVAGRYAPVLRDWLQQHWLLTDRLARLLQGHLNLPAEAYQIPASALSYDRTLVLLSAVPMPASYREALARSLATNPQAHLSLAEFLMRKLAEGMMEAFCFVFIAAATTYVLFWMARRVSVGLNKLPMVGEVNHLLGAAIGFLEVTVSLSVVLGLLAPFLSVQGLSGLREAVANSTLAQWLIAFYPVISRGLFGSAAAFLGL